MAEPAHGTATGTRISERTSDLVLPSDSAPESPSLTDAPERKVALSDSADPSPGTSRPAEASNPRTIRKRQVEATPKPEISRGVALPGDRQSISLKSYSLAHLTAGQTYLWRVKAISGGGSVIGASALRRVSMPQ